MDKARKQRIGAAFGAAAARYEDHAEVQRIAAALVADLAAQRRPPPDARILEIGCGTGFLTRLIQARWPAAALTVTDLSPAMVGRAAADGLIAGHFLAMDGEAPAFDGPWFDLILSSLAAQWFDDLPRALARLHDLLRPGGSLILSTMGAESFARWQAAHRACGEEAGTSDYPTLAAMRAMLARYADAFAFDEHHGFDPPDATALVRHLKAIGAHVPREGYAPLTSARLRRVMAAHGMLPGRDDYHVLYARITRVD
jgi:malonyl-CoA O-methyltransferase